MLLCPLSVAALLLALWLPISIGRYHHWSEYCLEVDEDCGPSGTGECCAGLSCHPKIEKCYHQPRKLLEPCDRLNFPCDEGLSCPILWEARDPLFQGSFPKCYHEPRQLGEPCIFDKCDTDSGLQCHGLALICTPGRFFDIHDHSTCMRLHNKEMADLLRVSGGANQVHTQGGIFRDPEANWDTSFEMGVAYGPDGEFGCYKTTCEGWEYDFSAIVGFVESTLFSWEDFAQGTSIIIGGTEAPSLGPKGGSPFAYSIITNEDGQPIGWTHGSQAGFPIIPFPIGKETVKCETELNSILPPGFSEQHAFQVNAVYTTNWAQWRSSDNGRPEFCDEFAHAPGSHLNPTLFTHIFYAFALVTPEFEVVGPDRQSREFPLPERYGEDPSDHDQLPFLPVKLYSIGGWSFSHSTGSFENEGTHKIFPALIKRKEGRTKFIDSAIRFAHDNHFQGIDLDWEYPNWRYNKRNDTESERTDFTTLLKEMYPRCKEEGLLLTAATKAIDTEPHYELGEIHKYLDWINLMSYDFYGGSFQTTSTVAKVHAPIFDCHSRWCNNTRDIDTGLNRYLKAGVPPSKIVFGLPTYGRTFELEKPDGSTPAPGRARASGGSPPAGECTQEKGFLAYYEIKRNLESDPKTSPIDEYGLAAYATYGDNGEYWVGFDNPESLHLKICYAASFGLRGTMAWDGELDAHAELLQAIKTTADGQRQGLSGSCSQFKPPPCPPAPADLECREIGSQDGGTGQAPSESCGVTYTIKTDDTCDSVSKENGLTVQQLKQLNPVLDCEALSIAQSVCLGSRKPPPAPPPIPLPSPFPPFSPSSPPPPVVGNMSVASGDCIAYHTIKSDDTCFSLMSKNDLSDVELVLLNPDIDCEALPVGSKVCLEREAASPPSPPPSLPPSPPPSPSTDGGQCSATYTIESGDTCNAVASENGLSVQQLKELNPGIDCSALAVGQSLCIASGGGCSSTYTIKDGDYCWLVASDNGLTVQQLKELNPGLDCSSLLVGQSVCVG